MIRDFTPFPRLHTQRLILRSLTMQDDHEIFELRSNDLVNQFLGRAKAQSLKDAQQFIQMITDNIQKNEGVFWAIALQHDPKLIGGIVFFNFDPENDRAELGYELLPQYHGQGIMQEAIAKVIEFGFNTMQLRSIEAWSHVNNINSSKLLERNHFIRQPIQPVPDMVVYQLNKV